MSTRELSFVTRPQGANAHLVSPGVRIGDSALRHVETPVLVHGFRRMVRELAYDVSEMALTTYLCAREHGVQFTAIPVFLVRGLHHGAVVRATDRPLQLPHDLRGARIGVNRGYTVTTGVWARGILESRYGVDLDDITWVLSGDEHVESYRPPANVVPVEGDTPLGDLVVSGELDAAIGVPADRPELTPLIDDHNSAAWTDLLEHDLYPINHLVVVRDELLAERPQLAEQLFEAFTANKQDQVRALRSGDTLLASKVDGLHRRIIDELDRDPLPYGIEPNRVMLEQLLDHATRQGILQQRPELGELFHPTTTDLVG